METWKRTPVFCYVVATSLNYILTIHFLRMLWWLLLSQEYRPMYTYIHMYMVRTDIKGVQSASLKHWVWGVYCFPVKFDSCENHAFQEKQKQMPPSVTPWKIYEVLSWKNKQINKKKPLKHPNTKNLCSYQHSVLTSLTLHSASTKTIPILAFHHFYLCWQLF